MKPELSIIVPVYNVEKYINKCIDSILAQTFRNFELILIDDGSPDNCRDICDKYAKLDCRIKVIHKKNGGLSSARNVGIDVAKGKYIGFVDSDDYIKDNMYELLYKAILKYKADISICDFMKFDENSEAVFNENLYKNIEIWTNIQALEKLDTDNCARVVVVWNKLYKKELWKNIRFPEGKIHEDVFVMHKILFKANKIINTNKVLYGYLQRNSSIIGSESLLNELDYIYGLKNRIEFYDRNNLKEIEEHVKIKLCSCIRNYYYKLKNSNIKNKEKYLRFLYNLFNSNYSISKDYKYISVKENALLKFFKFSPNLFVKILKFKKNILNR